MDDTTSRAELRRRIAKVTKERDDALADLREPHKERALGLLYVEGCEDASDKWDEMAERIIRRRDELEAERDALKAEVERLIDAIAIANGELSAALKPAATKEERDG